MVDDDLRLVAWNARMTEIFGMGAPVLQPGRRIDEAVADHLRRQGSDEETVEMMRRPDPRRLCRRLGDRPVHHPGRAG